MDADVTSALLHGVEESIELDSFLKTNNLSSKNLQQRSEDWLNIFLQVHFDSENVGQYTVPSELIQRKFILLLCK
jgi:hypothetical protein